MNTITCSKWMTNQARDYCPQAKDSVNRNGHMNECRGEFSIEQQDIDAIIVDFVNFCARSQGVDLALHVSDLKDGAVKEFGLRQNLQ